MSWTCRVGEHVDVDVTSDKQSIAAYFKENGSKSPSFSVSLALKVVSGSLLSLSPIPLLLVVENTRDRSV